MGPVTTVHDFPGAAAAGDTIPPGIEALLEVGAVVRFTQMPFELRGGELRLLDERHADPRAKNISLRWPAGKLRGAVGDATDLRDLQALLARFADASQALVERLCPHYRGALRRGNTSLRPLQAADRVSSWRKDDRRLHVDAFPSNPTQGSRLLRVFCNVNPAGEARRWRVGEPFEAHALRFLPSVRRPLPGSAWLLERLQVTKRRRTEYDHLMLQIHDRAKSDATFQRESPQATIDFAPGTTWLAYSDQVPHAVMAGRHLLEQTLHLGVEQLQRPETSPLRTLERLLGRPLR